MVDNGPDRWASLRMAFAPKLADVPEKPSEAEVTDLRKAIEEAAGQVRNLTFLFLTVGLYIGILSGTTTHRMLLIGEKLQLPILNIGVAITWAYALAPLLYLVLHFWLLRALLSLARRVDVFNTRVAEFDPDKAKHQRLLVTALPFVEWRAGRRWGRFDRLEGAALNFILYAGMPVALFLWVQLRFLPYQDDGITALHVLCLALDLGLLWAMWPTINGPGRSILARLLLGGMATLAAGFMALSMAFDQRHVALAWLEPQAAKVPWTERWCPAERRFEDGIKAAASLASCFNYAWSRLVVTDQILMKREPAPEIIAQLRASAGPGKEEEAKKRAYLDRDLAEPLNLSGRKLRYANLKDTRLLGVVINGADFTGAALWRADLQRAQGDEKTRFIGAELFSVQMQNSFLHGAQLQSAILIKAELQGASLMGAQLQGADLAEAQLQRAILQGGGLQGANLERAQLQGVHMVQAQMQGASLRGAQLQGATLTAAKLQGADLSEAQLQGASLKNAQLQGVSFFHAQLQGADLREANIWMASFYHWADFSLADLRKIADDPLEEEGVKDLRTRIESSISDSQLRVRVFERLERLLGGPAATWHPPTLPPERIRGALVDDGPQAPSEILAGRNNSAAFRVSRFSEYAAKPADVSQLATYDAKLADYLGQLACADDRVAKSLIWPRMQNDWYIGKRRSYVSLLATRLRDPACEGGKALDDEERRFLDRIRAEAPPTADGAPASAPAPAAGSQP